MTHAPRLAAVALACQLCLAHTAALAQTAPPDAGRALQQLDAPPREPRPDRPLEVQPPAPAGVAAGGASVLVRTVTITGNESLPSATLTPLLDDALGRTHDLASLRALAERISNRYHEAGYPFARAYLPPQDLAGGVLRIEVVEGRYGTVRARHADAATAEQAQAFLARLEPGAVITAAALERATLLLDDLPGVDTTPVMRPGSQTGTGDLDVAVSMATPFKGELRLDNHGSRYTGYHRLQFNADINSPFTLGDQIAVRTLLSDEKLLLGSVQYSRPLGGDGLRGQISVAQARYELGREYAALDGHGDAEVVAAGLNYALVRSRSANLFLGASIQHKQLRDKRDATGVNESKRSDALPLTAQFDLRDASGSGLTYGLLAFTPGRLSLGDDALLNDTNQTRGRYNKLNLDLTRLQALVPAVQMMARVSAQWADHNLDSSERMSLGGATGVRAYPSGEGIGDEGWLAQLELRYRPSGSALMPYAFYDAGGIRTLAKPPAGVDNPQRSLAGAGLGVGYRPNDTWSIDASLAWRTHGGVPQSDGGRDAKPRAWLSISMAL